jgi:hypothetical protein
VYTRASHKGNRYEVVHQMDTCYINDGIEMIDIKRGREHRSNRNDPRHVHRHTIDSCPVAQLTWALAMTLPQGR